MAILMCPQWSPSILNRDTLQYLSLCYRIAIQQDPQGGFTFQLANQQFRPAMPLHIAPELPFLDVSIQQRRNLQEHMPVLKEVRLRLIFFCPPRRSLTPLKRQER
ncbi:uncharacterized protein N7503_001836 [Penicillium pulvis]|uniref:uncharacterized protein n=1 Tax=Penicillium pulvis TaxID=1562058 RepID=UPI0025476D98|nr:uncharacterized protein N7503_001836 [Penicillium pulvis]KAJ5809618.1 hypothetical protein N7503_001836 [Penicillium pulvis]